MVRVGRGQGIEMFLKSPQNPLFMCVWIYIFFVLFCFVLKVTQSCPTRCDLMDYTVHGILQARILEWVAMPSSRRSSKPRDRTQVSHIAGRFFTSWATREALHITSIPHIYIFFLGYRNNMCPFCNLENKEKCKDYKSYCLECNGYIIY